MSPEHVIAYVCEKCGWADFHPTPRCPRCGSEPKQSAIPGLGRIRTFTTIRYPPSGFESQAPYVVAIIELENGPKVIGRVTSSPEVKIGNLVSLSSTKNGILEFQVST